MEILKVNRKIRRDESYYRLSSFLSQVGGIEVKAIQKIKKSTVYLVKTSNQKLILKKHSNKGNVLKQWGFFEKVNSPFINSFSHFPNGKLYLEEDEGVWTIAAYIIGEKLHYKNEQDRIKAVYCLKQFHKTARNIHVNSRYLNTTPYLHRWYHRFHLFKETKPIFEAYNYRELYTDIVKTTTLHLKRITQFPWQIYEEDAKHKGLWIHGDVAGHNFINNNNQHTTLIDFDLLQNTAPLYDYIQLGQRFLPYLNWDINKLLAYEMIAQQDQKAWLNAICIPVDMMREWLHFLKRNKNDNPISELVRMQDSWEKRQYFFNDMKIMLK
ncbi:phosphotransferase [Virgibacillus sp. Bac332]|uniref:phosphotransferase n=1 Tax=Virgibacillus sp. Bac332 TaxID=2419842 RepID=UPI000EF49846|nr:MULTISPECIES: phosphotransferase [Virgibacillus]